MKSVKNAPVKKKKSKAGGSFFAYDPLEMNVIKSNGRLLVYASNKGKNIAILKRVILRMGWPSGGATYLYLRENDFYFKKEEIEQGLGILIYRSNSTTAVDAQAYAEYQEVTGRGQSPFITF